MDGSWQSAQTWAGLKEDFVRIESFASRVPQSVRRQIRAASDAIESGKLEIFSGRLVTNDGKQLQEEGVLDDEQLHKMAWLTEGVIGRIR